MREQIIQRVRQCTSLPSLPTIAIQILELAQRADVDIPEIARLIQKDPALSTKILRTVNSSFYGRSQNVSTISHALVILGLQSVKTLVLSFSLVSTLTKSKSHGFKHIDYWRRSIYAATSARSIAAKLGVVQQEEAFLASLLMDIGMLVLDICLVDEYGEVYTKATSHENLLTLEREAFGITHAEIGGQLAQDWKLPPLLTTPITFHHDPGGVADPTLRKLTELVALSSRCADVFVEKDAAPSIAYVRKFCGERCKLSEPDCDALLAEIGQRTREVASLFEISIGAVANFEAILKKANETLADLTLQSQQQASTLQQHATTLKQQNAQLKEQAFTDALTSLSNRRRMDEAGPELFDKALKAGRPISVIMMDIDKFKSINDKHGHPGGDEVLRVLGPVVRGMARSEDLAVRYGGEEMALLLTGTTRATAAAMAETLRKKIAVTKILAGKVTIPVTSSFGVATFEPGGAIRTFAQLLKAADLALYHAKNSGRNCVKVFAIKAAAA